MIASTSAADTPPPPTAAWERFYELVRTRRRRDRTGLKETHSPPLRSARVYGVSVAGEPSAAWRPLRRAPGSRPCPKIRAWRYSTPAASHRGSSRSSALARRSAVSPQRRRYPRRLSRGSAAPGSRPRGLWRSAGAEHCSGLRSPHPGSRRFGLSAGGCLGMTASDPARSPTGDRAKPAAENCFGSGARVRKPSPAGSSKPVTRWSEAGRAWEESRRAAAWVPCQPAR